MKQLLDIAAEFLEENDLDFERHPDESLLRFVVDGDNGPLSCFARADDEAQQLVVYAVLSHRVSAERRYALAELITRMNFGIPIGNFELDFDDGEVRFKAGIDVERASLTAGLVRPLVVAAIVSMDAAAPVLRALASGDMEPLDAFMAYETDVSRIAD